MTSSTVQVRPMRSTDLASVVAEHQESLPDGLYARLGDRFLHTYHSAYLASPGTTGFVAELGTRPVGFVTGIVSTAAHRLAMKEAWPRLAAAAALALLQRPATLRPALLGPTAVSCLRHSARLLQPDPPCASTATATATATATGILTYLAVTTTARGRGVGDALLQAFLHQAQLRGCTKVTLATQAGAEGAAPFYAHRGWTPESVHRTTTGRPLQVMAWTYPPREVAQ